MCILGYSLIHSKIPTGRLLSVRFFSNSGDMLVNKTDHSKQFLSTFMFQTLFLALGTVMNYIENIPCSQGDYILADKDRNMKDE